MTTHPFANRARPPRERLASLPSSCRPDQVVRDDAARPATVKHHLYRGILVCLFVTLLLAGAADPAHLLVRLHSSLPRRAALSSRGLLMVRFLFRGLDLLL